MLSIFLFVVIFSFYFWLSYEPRRTSDQDQRVAVAAGSATATRSPTGATAKDAQQPDENDPIVQIVDKRTFIPEQPASIANEELAPELAPPESALPEEMPPTAPVEEPQAEPATVTNEDLTPEPEAAIEPVLTEEEAIALAVETTLASDATLDEAQGFQEDSSELIRPNPPDPELVEAAIRDAEEKSEDYSPPESVDTEEVETLKKEVSSENS